MNVKVRQQKLRALLEKQGIDALLVTHLPNVQYLCGFTGTAGAILLTAASATFFTDGRYTEQAREQVKGARVTIDRVNPVISAGRWLKRHRPRQRNFRLGIEDETLSVAARGRLARELPAGIKIQGASSLVEAVRIIKDEDELDRMRAAAALGVRLFDRILEVARPGITEKAVAAELEYAATKAGADGMSFPTIIAAGKRSALPHGRASEEAIPRGGFVVCDFGVILRSYCSDMTRTICVGAPTEDARRGYEAVLEAQQAAIAAVRPGSSVGEVDEAARNILKKKKLVKYFTHSTGHGVGLEIHEAPRLASGQRQVLEPGMVVTVEPGIYLPGKWGVRIEDMVVVTEGGCEILTPASKELMVV